MVFCTHVLNEVSLNRTREAFLILIQCASLVREISAHIAKEVIRAAQKAVCVFRLPICILVADLCFLYLQGVDRSPDLRTKSDSELLQFINSKMWNP